jgi:hypothetical protein
LYSRVSERKRYPSELSDERWALIEPVISAWKAAHRSVSGHQGVYEMREIDIVAITLFSPDSWRGAVTMSCPEQDDPRLRSSAAGQGWSPTRAIARVSGTPSISRLVIVAARAPRVPFDRSLSAMANTAP